MVLEHAPWYRNNVWGIYRPQGPPTRRSCIPLLSDTVEGCVMGSLGVGEQQISIVVQTQISCKRLDKGAAARMDRPTVHKVRSWQQ